jgi:hypothetical protein
MLEDVLESFGAHDGENGDKVAEAFRKSRWFGRVAAERQETSDPEFRIALALCRNLPATELVRKTLKERYGGE